MRVIINKLKPIILILIGLVLGVAISWYKTHLNKFPYIFSDNGFPIVQVDGSYIVKDQNGTHLSGMSDPTGVNGHTVHISCYKNTMVCKETQAFIGQGSHSIVVGDTNEFQIDEWTGERIVSKPLQVDNCTSEVLKIDRQAKTAIIINSSISKEGECAKLSKDTITFQIQ